MDAGNTQMSIHTTRQSSVTRDCGVTLWYNPSMAKLMITRGMVALVDDGDLARLLAHEWQARPNGSGKVYASRSTAGHGTITLQREVMGCSAWQAVRFVNGDTLDCRRENLIVFDKPIRF